MQKAWAWDEWERADVKVRADKAQSKRGSRHDEDQQYRTRNENNTPRMGRDKQMVLWTSLQWVQIDTGGPHW